MCSSIPVSRTPGAGASHERAHRARRCRGCRVAGRVQREAKRAAQALRAGGMVFDSRGRPEGGISNELSRWWTTLNDPQLDSLIGAVTHGRLDLKEAKSRVLQAPGRSVVRDDGLPQVMPTPRTFRSRPSENAGLPQPAGQRGPVPALGRDRPVCRGVRCGVGTGPVRPQPQGPAGRGCGDRLGDRVRAGCAGDAAGRGRASTSRCIVPEPAGDHPVEHRGAARPCGLHVPIGSGDHQRTGPGPGRGAAELHDLCRAIAGDRASAGDAPAGGAAGSQAGALKAELAADAPIPVAPGGPAGGDALGSAPAEAGHPCRGAQRRGGNGADRRGDGGPFPPRVADSARWSWKLPDRVTALGRFRLLVDRADTELGGVRCRTDPEQHQGPRVDHGSVAHHLRPHGAGRV